MEDDSIINKIKNMPRSLLIVSDSHADPKSLSALMELAESRTQIDFRIFLGDAIGYGDDPIAVLDILRKFDIRIRGNHELLALGKESRWKYSDRAAKSIDKHSETVGPDGMAFLASFIPSYKSNGSMFFHGTPRDAMEYPFNEDDIRNIMEKSEDIDIFFGGHLHMPRLAIFDRKTSTIEFEEVLEPYSEYQLDLISHRYFVNCPSSTPGRFGYKIPGCCILTHGNDDGITLEFIFIEP